MSSNTCDGPVGITSVEQVFSLLSAENTRHVLLYFYDSSESVASLDQLADCVASHRDEHSPGDPDDVATVLHHSTLPKLADAGVVDYDRRHHTVRYWGHPTVDAHLTHVTEIAEDRN